MSGSITLSGRYALTKQQHDVISMLRNNPSAVSRFILSVAFLVTPKIDLRRLERTFMKLVARHEALRQTFQHTGDSWCVNVWSSHRCGVLFEEHGDLSDAEFDALWQRQASLPIDLLHDDLFQVAVLRCGKRGDVLCIRAHHAIIDGHSMMIVFDDWLKLLIGLPLHGRGMTHQEYLAQSLNQSRESIEANNRYWEALLLPALPNPSIGKYGKGGKRPRSMYRADTTCSFKCLMSSTEYQDIPKIINLQTQTSFAIVLAAFADTLISVSGLPGIYVSTTVDRPHKSLSHYVGCSIALVPIRCASSKGMTFAEYVSELSLQMKQSMDHLPADMLLFDSKFDFLVEQYGGALRHFACNMVFANSRARGSSFSSGIVVEPGTPQKLGPLTITQLRIPAVNYNFHGLRVRISLYRETAMFDFDYHSEYYSKDDVVQLISGMQERMCTRLRAV